MLYRAKQGLFNGGYPRLGYNIDYENKCLVLNKSEIPIVIEIFKTYLQMGSLSETAKALNSKGYRMKSWTSKPGNTRGGLKFNKNSLGRILKDPIYIGKIKYKDQIYDGQQPAIVNETTFNAVQAMLNANYATKTGYRQDGHKFLLKGLVKCGSCRSAMIPSFSVSKGKEYYYYRCKTDEDSSKESCPTGSVNARELESLVADELKFLSKEPKIIEGVVENATKEQREKVKEILMKKKILQEQLTKVDKKAKNFLEILGTEGKKEKGLTYILKELKGLEEQEKELRKEIDYIDFEANNYESKIVNADLIRENLKVFKDIYDQLTLDEKYDLVHLLVKSIIYYEDTKADKNKQKGGKIKMDLWELPPIDTSIIKPADAFAERNDWRGGRGSNPRPPA